MLRLFLALCIVSAGVAVHARIAHAGDDVGERAARRHYERGQKLFNLQKFQDALDEFQKAYDAKPIPDFLFNIGQCHRNLGEYQAAIFSFKKFLKLDPEASNRDQVEQLITDLQRKIDEGDTERLGLKKKQPRAPTNPETGDRPVYKKWWFWTTVAVVGVGAGIGIYVAARPGAPDTTFGNIVFGK